MDIKNNQRLKFFVAIAVVIAIITFIVVKSIIYENVGEKNIPFKVSEIIVVSTAIPNPDEISTEKAKMATSWNFNVIQTNDVYVSIKGNQNNNKSNASVERATIENVKVEEPQKAGKILCYMPNSEEGDQFKYISDYIVADKLTFKGSLLNSYKDLLINKNEGSLAFSLANINIGKYASGKDTEISYTGKMLKKLGLKDEDVKFKVGFDIIIELSDKRKYSTHVSFEVPCDGITENGLSKLQLTDLSNLVYKRI